MDIREVILSLANRRNVKGFFASRIAKQTGQPLPVVNNVLDEMVQAGELHCEYQLYCHNEDCFHTIDQVNSVSDLKSEYECNRCGREIEEIDKNFIQPIYMGIHRS